MTGATATTPAATAGLTPAQARTFLDSLEACERASPRPCPDLLEFIADCRAAPALLPWELDRWPVYDGDRWEAPTLVEHVADAGALLPVVHGAGARGVVMLADDRFYPVHGDPSVAWYFTAGDDHPGFETAPDAVAYVAALDRDRLFNCCTDGTAPDWSAFVSLRLGGCVDHGGETEGCVSSDRAQFFTVYGIDAHGMAEAITDTPEGASLPVARAMLAELATLSGLPSHDCRFLTAEA